MRALAPQRFSDPSTKSVQHPAGDDVELRGVGKDSDGLRRNIAGFDLGRDREGVNGAHRLPEAVNRRVPQRWMVTPRGRKT